MGYFKYIIYLLPCLFLGQEKIYFNSKNPFSFKDIIQNSASLDDQQVYGFLRFPEDSVKDKIYPLIIAVAGSNGWSSHHYEYLNMYRASGIATFELCSFNSRGVNSTVGTQVEVTTAMMVLDAYNAAEELLNHSMIDSNNIGITGWSLGGGVALFSAWEPLKNSIDSHVSFAAHLSLYPPCIVMPTILDFGTSPIHILIGELDNWTPADACIELVNSMGDKSNINLTIYADAHHSFDGDELIQIKHNGYILEDCRFILKEDGTVLMNFLNIPMTTPILQKMGLAMCAKRGPTYGGNKKAKVQSFEFSRDFMVKNLID